MRRSFRHTQPEWPISLEELKQRRDQCVKAESRSSIVFLILFFGFLFANVPFVNWIESNTTLPAWVKPAWLGLFMVVLIGNLPLMVYLLKRRVRSFGLNCPSCDKMVHAQAMAIAVATGHCSHCGVKLVKDHTFQSPHH